MMTFKNRATQIIELLPTALTFVSLAMGLVTVKATLVNFLRCALWTAYSFWPAQLSYHCKTFCVVNQVLDIQHAHILPEMMQSLIPVKSLVLYCR
jgi:hypothetical protein